MIAASAVLTVTAAVLFVVGLFATESSNGLIWGSIAAAVAALASLAAGVIAGRRVATIGGVPVGGGEVPFEPQMREATEEIAAIVLPEAEEAPTLVEDWAGVPEEPEAARRARARKPSSRGKPSPRAKARAGAAKGTARQTAAKATPRAAKPAARAAGPRKTSEPAPRRSAAKRAEPAKAAPRKAAAPRARKAAAPRKDAAPGNG